ncbi:MAG: UbiD family decarboxylase [Desulfobacterales bacterium]|nr:UbiD family decarboxylase [Desulfobacterales bacterium]
MRNFLKKVDQMGELVHIQGAHWNEEIGALRFMARKGDLDCPAILFDDIPDYPSGYRVLCGSPNSSRRLAMILGIEHDSNEPSAYLDLIRKIRDRLKDIKSIPPKVVKDGPVMENVRKGNDVDLFEFPAPKWQPGDSGRYIGTMDAVISRDPEQERVNMGTYRTMIRDKTSLLTYVDPGKHFHHHRNRWFELGKDMPVAICFGADPLFPVISGVEFPENLSELEVAGGFRGQPVEVIKGEITGLPFPADAEIVVEGFVSREQRDIEGPFAEFTGYYGSGAHLEPVINIKAVYFRNQPVLHGLLTNGRPPKDRIGRRIDFRTFLRSAQLWHQLELVGIPDIRGVYCHPAGGARMWVVISLKQRYVGHSKQALAVASQTHTGAFLGRYVITVDEDVDPTYDYDVIWALSTRSDPVNTIDFLRKTWSGPLDPQIPAELKQFCYNSRALIDACIPFERKGQYAPTARFDRNMIKRLKEKFL